MRVYAIKVTLIQKRKFFKKYQKSPCKSKGLIPTKILVVFCSGIIFVDVDIFIIGGIDLNSSSSADGTVFAAVFTHDKDNNYRRARYNQNSCKAHTYNKEYTRKGI